MVVFEPTIKKLVAKVEKLKREDWKTAGGISYSPGWYLQAMEKHEHYHVS
jgi:hypothetical protein